MYMGVLCVQMVQSEQHGNNRAFLKIQKTINYACFLSCQVLLCRSGQSMRCWQQIPIVYYSFFFVWWHSPILQRGGEETYWAASHSSSVNPLSKVIKTQCCSQSLPEGLQMLFVYLSVTPGPHAVLMHEHLASLMANQCCSLCIKVMRNPYWCVSTQR